MDLTAALIIAGFTVLPGAWLVCLLPLQPLRPYARLAIGISLSPPVLALQALVLKVLQIPFANIPTILLIINLPALYWIVRLVLGWQWPRVTTWLGGGALLSLLSLYLFLPWRMVPGLRAFAWHGLWHTDITYALTRNTLLPEEPELAGMQLAYGWFGHFFWSISGWLADVSPTILYAMTNLIWLGVAVALAYALCRDGLNLSRPMAVLGTGTIFVGTNIVGTLAWLHARDWHWQRFYLGDVRYTPMLGKYLGFETMPFAFALLIGLVYLCMIALRRPIRHLWAITTALLIALGLIYPILFPAGAVIVGLLWLLLILRRFMALDGQTSTYSWSAIFGMAAGALASLLVTYIVLQLITIDGNNTPLHLTVVTQMQSKGIQAVIALLLFVPGLLYLAKAMPRRDTPGLLLAGSTIGLLALYVVMDLAALEYKYVSAATIVAAPLGAAGLTQLIPSSILRWTTTFVLLIVLTGSNLLLMLDVGAQIPTNLVNAPLLDESGFWIELEPAQQEADWVTAIRTNTSPETIVATTNSQIHLTPFLDRTLYAPSNFDGAAVAGYSVDNRYNLLSWRGYAAAEYDQRLLTVQTLQAETSVEWIMALTQLLSLQRPVTLHLAVDAPIIPWLETSQLGSELYRGEEDVVWLIEPSATTWQALESASEHASN